MNALWTVKLRDDNSDESVENEIWEEELQHDLEDFEFVHDNICQSDEDILDEELRELADKRSGVNWAFVKGSIQLNNHTWTKSSTIEGQELFLGVA